MDNRNTYGFALFALIILSAVFIKFMFAPVTCKVNSSPAPVEVSRSIEVKERIVCDAFKVRKRVAVEQAVLNLETGVFDLSFDLNKQLIGFSPIDKLEVRLDFYVKDSKIRKVATETAFMPLSDLSGLQKNFFGGWVRKLKANQTVYVIPTVIGSATEEQHQKFNDNSAIGFDYYAIPVLLVVGK